MPPDEFGIIEAYFRRPAVERGDVALGVGDDAALLAPPPGQLLAVTTDTLLEGVHFPHATGARAVGHKSLAASLSDLAAMGAEPAWATVALSLPRPDRDWLGGFCDGFDALSRRFRVQRVGGDLVRGALAVTVQAIGLTPAKSGGLRRAGARPGDDLYLSGFVGDAALGLLWQHKAPAPGPCPRRLREALDLPQPRVELGLALRGLASACIDVSDGLLADLGHLLRAGGGGASLQRGALPLSPEYRELLPQVGWDAALCHGDDYELCFSAAPAARAAVAAIAARLELGLHRIGVIEERPGIRLHDEHGRELPLPAGGYNHFGRGGE